MANFVIVFHLISFFLMVAVGFLASGATTYNHLLPGDILKNGVNLTEANYNLFMQPDCNLVLYQENPEEAIWSTHTDNKGNRCEAALKTDGNFVINDQNGTVIAHTGTNKTVGNYVFLLQRDRNIVLYSQSIWSSGTNISDQPTTTLNNQAIQLHKNVWFNELMLLGACICALLF